MSDLVVAPPPLPEESAGAIYRRALRSHLGLVMLIVLTAIAVSVLILKVRAPTYSANAQLLITPVSQTDVNLLGLPLIRDTGESTRTAQTAAALLQTPDAARLAAQRMGGGLTPQAVRDAVTIEPRGQTNLLVVQATSDGARRSAQLADCVRVGGHVAAHTRPRSKRRSASSPTRRPRSMRSPPPTRRRVRRCRLGPASCDRWPPASIRVCPSPSARRCLLPGSASRPRSS